MRFWKLLLLSLLGLTLADPPQAPEDDLPHSRGRMLNPTEGGFYRWVVLDRNFAPGHRLVSSNAAFSYNNAVIHVTDRTFAVLHQQGIDHVVICDMVEVSEEIEEEFARNHVRLTRVRRFGDDPYQNWIVLFTLWNIVLEHADSTAVWAGIDSPLSWAGTIISALQILSMHSIGQLRLLSDEDYSRNNVNRMDMLHFLRTFLNFVAANVRVVGQDATSARQSPGPAGAVAEHDAGAVDPGPAAGHENGHDAEDSSSASAHEHDDGAEDSSSDSAHESCASLDLQSVTEDSGEATCSGHSPGLVRVIPDNDASAEDPSPAPVHDKADSAGGSHSTLRHKSGETSLEGEPARLTRASRELRASLNSTISVELSRNDVHAEVCARVNPEASQPIVVLLPGDRPAPSADGAGGSAAPGEQANTNPEPQQTSQQEHVEQGLQALDALDTTCIPAACAAILALAMGRGQGHSRRSLSQYAYSDSKNPFKPKESEMKQCESQMYFATKKKQPWCESLEEVEVGFEMSPELLAGTWDCLGIALNQTYGMFKQQIAYKPDAGSETWSTLNLEAWLGKGTTSISLKKIRMVDLTVRECGVNYPFAPHADIFKVKADLQYRSIIIQWRNQSLSPKRQNQETFIPTLLISLTFSVQWRFI
ncbi:hypothetical protein DCS_04939 [Drechmeria coniospora]|uniref:Uncharacterized protein n=1 Tax=Drechmeria coniospora TaxID=98403 RepID=A0A151GLF7_DRECN|nr:hypothetical protein DCS_04939 [Drechmeria coniospora]KYK57926.1 hypothetical protein DCS_04939 [Drechmeria coniospora]